MDWGESVKEWRHGYVSKTSAEKFAKKWHKYK